MNPIGIERPVENPGSMQLGQTLECVSRDGQHLLRRRPTSGAIGSQAAAGNWVHRVNPKLFLVP
jgi:hypothetical protein